MAEQRWSLRLSRNGAWQWGTIPKQVRCGRRSSEPALPTLMEKMEQLRCSKALVGRVVPTGYTFNTDGSSPRQTR
jgi:hypothetical protein